MKSAQIS